MTPEEMIQILKDMPGAAPVFYRLYHDEQGNPLFYSMADVPGLYVEIDRDTYVKNSMRVKVVNQQVIEVTWKTVDKLVPGDNGTPCDTRDVAVVVNYSPNIKWSKQTYAIS